MSNRREILKILHNSLSGIKIKVINHTDNELIGREGEIRTETRRMITLREIDGTIIGISKIQGIFRFFLGEDSIEIEGSLLEGDAKRRSKRRLKHW